MGIVHIGMAGLRYERDDLDGASALERGVELAERTGDVSTLWVRHPLEERAGAGGRGGRTETALKRSASPATPAPICRSPSP